MPADSKSSKNREPTRGDSFSSNFIARGELVQTIRDEIQRRDWTQTQAAEFFGVSQPRISHLMQGRIEQFTVDMLMLWAEKLGKDVSVQVRANVFSSHETVRLTLYVLGGQKQQAEDMVAQLFQGNQDKYELTVIDVLDQPEAARKARITATPSLVKEYPEPRTIFVGDLSAASIRWQVATAEQRSREERDGAQDLRQASQDARDDALNTRERMQESRENRQDARQERSHERK